MKVAVKNLEFEKAAKLRDRIFALQHIQDVALINEEEMQTKVDVPARIEAYDISNISGAFCVGSMVVFSEGLIDKSQYRKFKIKNQESKIKNGANDIAAIKEMISRRLEHKEWQMPELILVDGGKGQVNGAKDILAEKKIKISVIGIAKGPKRDRNDIVNPENIEIDKKLLIRIRDEAHRFAIQYYRLRHRRSLR